MAQLGADVEQLDRLGAKLKERAAAMDDTVRQLSTQLNGTWWKGADADAFRARWDGELRAQITKVKTLLETTAQTVAKQAADQRQVSGA